MTSFQNQTRTSPMIDYWNQKAPLAEMSIRGNERCAYTQFYIHKNEESYIAYSTYIIVEILTVTLYTKLNILYCTGKRKSDILGVLSSFPEPLEISKLKFSSTTVIYAVFVLCILF